MKVILYMAISVDGFIAKVGGDSDWVSGVDIPIFEQKIKESECIVVGHNTFKQFYGDLYPVKGVINIVVSKSPDVKNEEGVFFVKSPQEAVGLARSKGFEQVLLVGGGTVNGSFMKEGLIDKIFVDIHPFVFGEGIKIFEGFEGDVKLELLESKNLGRGQILLHYKVIK